MFKIRSKSLNITERDPIYKVKYLGNVLTAFMRGDGCVDRPVSVLWNNYLSNQNTAAVDMQLTVCVAGLKARTKDIGLTEYRAHRISYCICHPLYPRVFVWVYRHEGKKMKMELRCHAVLCKSDAVAKAIAVQLHDKLSFALSEFSREKTRRQRARLALQRANSLPNGVSGFSIPVAAAIAPPKRTKFLTVGQNFKPPSDQSTGAPKLGVISEDLEEEFVGEKGESVKLETEKETKEKEDLNQTDNQKKVKGLSSPPCCDEISLNDNNGGLGLGHMINGELADEVIDLEIGNDIFQLKNDADVQKELVQVDSDSDASVESGFSE